MDIIFDLGGVSNHDNENALSTVDAAISAGSVIDITGAIATGVAITTPNPFGSVNPSTADNASDTQVTPATRTSHFQLDGSDSAQHVITGLANGDWFVEVYGQRNQSDDRTGTVQFNGGTIHTFNANNAGTFAERTAEETVTISDGTLTVNYGRGTGSFSHFSRLKLEQQETNQAPTLDTPQPDVTIQEGQTGTIDLGANFSDPNAGDTLTFSISPDISLVTGFSFNTSTGVVSYDGNQVAASAIAYTVTASDGSLTADDTFNLTVTVPALSVDSISDTTPQPGDSIVITVSNKAGTITAGDYTITAQDATTVTVTVPDPTAFTLTGETYPTLPFEANVSIPLNDGVTTANAVIQIQVPTGDDYTEITSIASGGFYANDVGVTAGMFGYVYDVVGTPYYDTATGAYALGDGDSFNYRIYNGEWGSSATVAEGSDPEVVVSQIILRDVLRDVLKPILRGVFDD